MIIIFKKISENEFSFNVDNGDLGTVEKHIDKYGKDNWLAIDNMDGLQAEGKTKKEAVDNLLIKVMANKPDEIGNAHTCKTNPTDFCIKCMYM